MPAPVRRLDWTNIGEADYDTPHAPSLGSLVAHWTDSLRTGRFNFDVSQGCWTWVPETEIFTSSDAKP